MSVGLLCMRLAVFSTCHIIDGGLSSDFSVLMPSLMFA